MGLPQRVMLRMRRRPPLHEGLFALVLLQVNAGLWLQGECPPWVAGTGVTAAVVLSVLFTVQVILGRGVVVIGRGETDT